MDILDDILKTLDMRGALYFRTDFNGIWGTTVPDYQQAARFHLLVQGVCHVNFPSGTQIKLTAGDLVLIPNGISHILSDSGMAKAPPLETVMEQAGYDGEGVLRLDTGDPSAATQMICGHFSFRKGAEHPMLSLLPEFVHVTGADRANEPWLDDTLRLLRQRMFSGEPGATATVTRLSEIVFIELLKSQLLQSNDAQPVLKAMKDTNIAAALKAIHETPDHEWTVDSLAQHIGMSRSRFADKFSRSMGVGPMKYLADWRLQKALVMLDDDRNSIQEIALKSGYKSAAAFSRAFTKKFGSPPSVYKR